MTPLTCRRCGKPIRLHGIIWMHTKPSIAHAAMPPVKVAPPSESEQRAMYGDR